MKCVRVDNAIPSYTRQAQRMHSNNPDISKEKNERHRNKKEKKKNEKGKKTNKYLEKYHVCPHFYFYFFPSHYE